MYWQREYIFRDCYRIAKTLDVPFIGPPGHPFKPLLPLRSCIAAGPADSIQRFKLSQAVATACWGSGKDISNEAVSGSLMSLSSPFWPTPPFSQVLVDVIESIPELKGKGGEIVAKASTVDCKQALLRGNPFCPTVAHVPGDSCLLRSALEQKRMTRLAVACLVCPHWRLDQGCTGVKIDCCRFCDVLSRIIAPTRLMSRFAARF